MGQSLLAMACALALLAAQAQYTVAGVQAGGEVSPTQDEVARNRAEDAYMHRVAQALGRAGDARHLAFAVLLDAAHAPRQTPGQATVWLQAALDAAGQDVQAYRLIASTKSPDAAALRAEALRRWSRLEPDNLAPLMHQKLPLPQWLEQARSATYLDSDLYGNVRWMQSALLRHPPTAQELVALNAGQPFSVEENAAVTALGISAAFAFPGYGVLTLSCKEERLSADAQQLADCRHVAQLLATRSSTLLDQALGWSLLRQLAQSEDERARAQEQRRRLDWLMHQSMRHIPRLSDVVRLLSDSSIQNERQMTERRLQQAGIALEPPPGWQLPTPPR